LAAQHHYVSRFHLAQFTDPDSLSLPDPWVWQGLIAERQIRRRAPKNIATIPLMFDGPGGLADQDSTIESHLANEVEGPAAAAMRDFCRNGGEMPAAMCRYLAWAAARSLPMQNLLKGWSAKGFGKPGVLVEEPPKWLTGAKELRSAVAMTHPVHGSRTFPPETDWDRLGSEGWYPDMSDRHNFLQAVHVQAAYFLDRFFPRLNWFTLRTPTGEFFVIPDRGVMWAADGHIDAPPSALRLPSAYVLAPISRDLVVAGKAANEKWDVAPDQINAILACSAHNWIAGPTESTVRSALEARQAAIMPR
jgi:hypothetical protein